MNNPPPGAAGFDREREHLEELTRQRVMYQHQEDLAVSAQRERERQERERSGQQFSGAPAHQNNTGSIPIHQPVASRIPGAIHSPGGILARQETASTAGPLGAPSGPGNAFGGPLHSEANRAAVQHSAGPPPAPLSQHQGFGPSILNHTAPTSSSTLGGSAGPGIGGSLQQQQQQHEAASRLQQIPFGQPMTSAHQIPGAPALAQGGQQPILNDALSYLDQVKVQFADQPDVYNRFLDIMKDFKSQAIDTPGVINRVSELFAGHPNLIQGFNTFLPPGYRIECGTGSDPNTIRVTTPMGTTVQSISGSGRLTLPDSSMQGGSSAYYGGSQRPGGWQSQNQHESPEGLFSPQAQNAGPAFQRDYEAQQAAAAAAAHQQQQRGVSQLTSAVATLGHPPAATPTPGQVINGGQAGGEKRGPVEFNHAISYVNKIKNRFQDRPEIYKQFLEILQTYQRESKPIQDVYAQVTLLFNTAPDLLEDFKQFLPESAAQAKAAAAAKAAEEVAALAGHNQNSQGPFARDAKMPPVGNFAVGAGTGKDTKKRARNAGTGNQVNSMVDSRGMSDARNNKRPKLHNNRLTASDQQAVSPTLTPIMPEPMPPTSTSATAQDELAFFDRVKKYIANKSTMNEFLKLCNLFSQDLIDRNTLVYRVSNFIGGNPDLLDWFKKFLGYQGDDEVVENQPKPPTGRVVLSNCRGLGPSYRLLPKRERLKPCSGRDEMCLSVLNDDWASHPTWASEDSGFVAHRKNIFEEGLHRIEEERHDYDFNIEANAKVIQLLEPYAQQILAMDPHERENFRLPMPGGSTAIYNRVLKKVYGDRGHEVTRDLFKDAHAVLPIVLARLKQKDEEWRFTQREWEKVWRAQTQSMYLKSLDHMGIHAKTTDKKNLAPKQLIDTIKTKHEEQRRQRLARGKGKIASHQFSYSFEDQGVISDVLRFMMLYATNASQHNAPERRRIADFFAKFISTFFDIPEPVLDLGDEDRVTPEDDADETPQSELPNGRNKRPVNGKKPGLLRDVLDKGRNGARGRKEDSATGSKESTPDVESTIEDEAEAAEEQMSQVNNENWAKPPKAVDGKSPTPKELDLKADQPFEREWYSLFCNQNIFVFFNVFQTLYRRFKNIKDCEEDAIAEHIRDNTAKPARRIGIVPAKVDYPGPADGETWYTTTLSLAEDFIAGEVEEVKYHDWLRHYYLQKGWQLYTITDLLKTLCRLGAHCSSNDVKEKTPDLIAQYYHDRESKDTTHNTEINMRKQAEKYIKDGELFVIKWWPKKNEATTRWYQKDETTFDLDIMERKERWLYYTSSFVRIEPTEGVPRDRMTKSLLTRNLPSGDTESEDGFGRKPLVYDENLTMRICVNSSRINWSNFESEFFIYADKALSWDTEKDMASARVRLQKQEEARTQRFQEKFVLNNKWMSGLNHDDVQRYTQATKKWFEDGVVPVPADLAAPVVTA